MNIPAHIKEVVLSVYSIDYLLKCRVCGMDGNKLLAAPVSNKVDMFQFNDPVVLLYIDRDQLHMISGDIKTIDDRSMEIGIALAEHDVEDNRRIFERYPASMSLSARRKFSSKRLSFVAKNISLYGIGAVSRADLDVDELVDIDLIAGKYMFYFGGKVVWKNQLENCFEYGFQLTDFDIATKKSFEVYLGKLKSEFLNAYSKAR
jgi:hypothetical protein